MTGGKFSVFLLHAISLPTCYCKYLGSIFFAFFIFFKFFLLFYYYFLFIYLLSGNLFIYFLFYFFMIEALSCFMCQ